MSARNPKPSRTSADNRFSQTIPAAGKRGRSAAALQDSSIHHANEPVNTPAMNHPGDAAPAPATSAANDRMVIGFESVSTNVVANPLPSAACDAFVRHACHASQHSSSPPAAAAGACPSESSVNPAAASPP